MRLFAAALLALLISAPAAEAAVSMPVPDPPEPRGYDPGLFFTKGVDDESFGCLRLLPWRIELWSLVALMKGEPPLVWRA